MGEYRAVAYSQNDSLFVKCLGFEGDSSNAHWGPGYRNYCILHYVVSGSGFFNGNKVREGQGFFIEKQQLQEYHSDPEDPWNYFWIMFSEEFAKKYVLPVLNADANQIFSYRFKRKLFQIRQDIFSESACMSHTQALSFLFHLISLHEAAAEPAPCIPAQHVRNARLFIEHNYNKNITVKDVAENLHINERYLYNLFIKYEGISLKEYISRQRCFMACELLSNTNFTVSEIARYVGFPDVCTFSKFFSKREKISPSKYRETCCHLTSLCK